MAPPSRKTSPKTSKGRSGRSAKKSAGKVAKGSAKASTKGRGSLQTRSKVAGGRNGVSNGLTKAITKGVAATSSGGLTSKSTSAPTVTSITPFLWFDNNFQEAASFYVSLFPNSRIDGVNPMGGSFTLAGQRFMGLNGGPQYKFTPATSFFVVCRDQAEVDRIWNALEKEGTPSRCGWIDDKFGLTWQIIPQAFLDLTSGPNPKKVQAVFSAMMGMIKMDVAGLQAAYKNA